MYYVMVIVCGVFVAMQQLFMLAPEFGCIPSPNLCTALESIAASVQLASCVPFEKWNQNAINWKRPVGAIHSERLRHFSAAFAARTNTESGNCWSICVRATKCPEWLPPAYCPCASPPFRSVAAAFGGVLSVACTRWPSPFPVLF